MLTHAALCGDEECKHIGAGDVVLGVQGLQGGKQNDCELFDAGVCFNLDIACIADVLTNCHTTDWHGYGTGLPPKSMSTTL